MATNDAQKRDLTPEERRRRVEARKRRQKELERRRRKKLLLLIVGGVLVIAALIFLIVGVVRLLRNEEPPLIEAKGSSFVIALDPGHGGEDTGMSGGGTTEKEITFAICEKLKIMLESQGYEVIMTREEDSYISKEDRVSLVNASYADLLVSVHCNYSETNTSLEGATFFYQTDNSESEYLAGRIESYLVRETGVVDNACAEGDSYTILNDTEIPAVLVEIGYLSNEEEAYSLADDVYQNDLAKGLAKGIIYSLDRQ